jgi:hypothetical protein
MKPGGGPGFIYFHSDHLRFFLTEARTATSCGQSPSRRRARLTAKSTLDEYPRILAATLHVS